MVVVIGAGWLVHCGTICMFDRETAVARTSYGAPVKRVGFRGRLFLILLAFALVPSILISLAWSATGSFVLPLFGATAAWDSAAATGERAVDGVRERASDRPRSDMRSTSHEETLAAERRPSRAKPISCFAQAAQSLALTTLFVVLVLGVVASRVAGHLSRNLSRPLQELVGWTERIGRGEPLPTTPPRRGAPEFEVLRTRMREMAGELELGRARALEAERAAALRESARQVAHELKNPLTPIRFAVERLRRDAPPELAETVEVLAIESQRLEAMARSFAQFGRLPEGPRAEVDVGELARYTARATIPPELDGERGRRRRRADDPRPSRCAGARAVERHAERGRRVPRAAERVACACARADAARTRCGRDRGVRHRVRNSARPSGAHLGAVRHVQARRHRARPGDRATDGARARRRAWPRTARSGAEPRFDSCCPWTADATEEGMAMQFR